MTLRPLSNIILSTLVTAYNRFVFRIIEALFRMPLMCAPFGEKGHVSIITFVRCFYLYKVVVIAVFLAVCAFRALLLIPSHV